MAIDTTEQPAAEFPGEVATRQHPIATRSEWLRPHLGWAIVGGVLGYLFGHWLGNLIASGYTNIQGSGQNDVAIVLALAFAVVGWLIGIGALNYPLNKMLGREPPPPVPERG